MTKSFKLFIITLCLLMLMVPLFVACNESTSTNPITSTKGEKLIIYNWEEYVDYKNLDGFKDYYKTKTGRDIDIVYTTFDTNETMMTKVFKNDANVDLICPSEYSVERLMRGGYCLNLKEVEKELQPTLDQYGITLDAMHNNIEPNIIKAIDNTFSKVPVNGVEQRMNDYIIPYMWGTLGIMYNTEVVTQADIDAGWGLLWNEANNPNLDDKILIKDSVRDAYACGALYLKEYNKLPEKYAKMSNVELINCTDEELKDLIEEALVEQRAHISGYEVDFGKDDMINGLIYANLSWSGDAMWAKSESYNPETGKYLVDYFVPEIGGNIWYDAWIMPPTVKNKLAAMMFIDYMCAPEHAILNSEEIGYTSAVAKDKMMGSPEVLEILEGNGWDTAEYFGDIGRYPEINKPEVLAKLGVMSDYGKRNEDIVQMWERVKAGGTVSLDLIWVSLGIIGGCLLVALIYFIAQLLKRRPRVIKADSQIKQNA